MGVSTLSLAAAGVSSALAGKSHGSIARHVGIDKSYVTMILKGTRTPSTDVMRKLAVYLGVTMDTLDTYLLDIRRDRAA